MGFKQELRLNLLAESHAIPFEKVREAIDFMGYGSPERVMFEMLILTGCRITELDRMVISKIYGSILYWGLGKNQKSFRKEALTVSYLKELKYYRDHHRVYGNKIFGIHSHTFRRYFNRDVRPNLSKEWQEKTLFQKKGALVPEYVYQLKGLRKNFQTLEFKKELEKWKDSGVALEFTSKKMKHSSKHITAYHYLVNFDTLGINNLSELEPSDLLKKTRQTRLMDFQNV